MNEIPKRYLFGQNIIHNQDFNFSDIEEIKNDQERMKAFLTLFQTLQEYVGEFLVLPTVQVCLQIFGKVLSD